MDVGKGRHVCREKQIIKKLYSIPSDYRPGRQKKSGAEAYHEVVRLAVLEHYFC
jgi:hypothetical protein